MGLRARLVSRISMWSPAGTIKSEGQDTRRHSRSRIGAAASASHDLAHVKIDQVNKEFVPLVIVVRTNTEINFPNSDNFRHSIYSFSQPKIFTTKLYSGKQAPPVLFAGPAMSRPLA